MSGDNSSNTPAPLILIVDDDNDTRAVIRQSLAALGHVVHEAVDGVDAQEKCAKAMPDLIVLDLMMPRMTGMQFLQWFRQSYSEPFVPVLLLTALNTIDQKVEGFEGEADEYLAKPFNFRELQARVKALLRISALTNALFRRTADLEKANNELSLMQDRLIAKERELVAAQMAGAAAHNLGQPLTTVLLHCRILSNALGPMMQTDSTVEKSGIEQAIRTAQSIQRECEQMSEILGRLKSADPGAVTEYVGGVKILDLKE